MIKQGRAIAAWGGNVNAKVPVTNTKGEVRFLGIDPGTVSLQARLEGFSTLDFG